MKQSGHLNENESLSLDKIKELLRIKFNEIDYKLAKDDVTPFIPDSKEIELWDKDLFLNLVNML